MLGNRAISILAKYMPGIAKHDVIGNRAVCCGRQNNAKCKTWLYHRAWKSNDG